MTTINSSTVVPRNADRPVRMCITYTLGFLIMHSITCIKTMHNLGSLLH